MGGDTAVMREDTELMGDPPSPPPPLGKTLIRKVVEVLAEVDDILLTDSSIRYISPYIIMSSPSNQYVSNKYTLIVDRHIYFAVYMLAQDSQKV